MFKLPLGVQTIVCTVSIFTLGTACSNKKDNPVPSNPTNSEACTDVGLLHGESKDLTVFKTSTVPFGSSCEAEQTEVTISCSNGNVEGLDASFATSCTVAKPQSCEELDLASGSTKTVSEYAMSTVAFGESCDAQKVDVTYSCNNGVLSRDTAGETFASCEITEPLSCDGTLHGKSKSVKEFSAASVAFDESCQDKEVEITYTCNNGQFERNSTETSFESCQVEAAKNCEGLGLNHGDTQTRKYFSSLEVEFGQSCDSVSKDLTISCNNGNIVGLDPQFGHASCQAKEALACEGGIAHGETTNSTKKYRSTLAGSTEGCDALSTEITQTCDNGTLTASAYKDKEYVFDSCETVDSFKSVNTQFWIFDNGKFENAPWKSSNTKQIVPVVKPSEKHITCAIASTKELQKVLEKAEVSELIKKVQELGGTPNINVIVSDAYRASRDDNFPTDRDAYFWHWNQDKLPSQLITSQFKKGSFVWEASSYFTRCNHPDEKEMIRYLKYVISRLENSNSL